MSTSLIDQPGILWKRVVETTASARASGALQPVTARLEIVEQERIRFQVRTLTAIAHKIEAAKAQREASVRQGHYVDPFQPWEPTLYVADASATHVCLLNKFNLVDHHLLIVTRAFEHQMSPLTAVDFESAWRCLAEYEGLAFYNAGRIAGASQAHKHLQMIPLPLPGSDTDLPLGAWISHTAACGGLSENRELPFRHVISGVDPQWLYDPVSGGQEALSVYHEMRARAGLRSEFTAGARQLPPYNLLLTRNWIMFVPRREAPLGPAEVNALGFVGALLARDDDELQTILDSGPLMVLEKAGLPRKLG